MPAPRLSPELAREAADALRGADGNQSEAARRLGVNRATYRARLTRARELGYLEEPAEPAAAEVATAAAGEPTPEPAGTPSAHPKPRYAVRADGSIVPVAGGRVRPMPTETIAPPPTGGVRRFILTSAQNNTLIFAPLWSNLKALARHYGAEIMVGTYAYDVSSYGQMSVKRGRAKHDRAMWYAPEIEPHVADKRVEIAPGLVWCGEMNISPTAARPLSGLQAYTGIKSSIFPHAKVALESIASGKHDPAKICYTTGAATLRNYIAKKAGLKGEFHHCYAALLVEVDSAGDWFVRQLNADSEGTVYDLDARAQGGRVTRGHAIEAVTWGDIHAARIEPEHVALAWGAGGILDTLRPRLQFLHDLLDFRARNHHERGNPHRMFERHVEGTGNVRDELKEAAELLATARREWCQTVVVDSNHDNALERWLREADYRHDPENAVLFLEAQLEKYRAIERRDPDFHLVEWAMRRYGATAERFLREDESFVICPDSGGGIEAGMHGHLGPNGSRGSANAFARMGRKSNTGHTHSAGIVDGVYTAGIMAALDQGYNSGPSSWSRSHVATYPNGKRAILTQRGLKWRAR